MPDPDPRLPVRISPLRPPPPAGWVVLAEGSAPSAHPPFARLPAAEASRHPAGVVCFCCAPRGATAPALARVLRRLADGEVKEVRGLWIIPESPASAVRLSALLRGDPLLAGRLREIPPPDAGAD